LPFDTTPFVAASIKEVAITLVEAMVLVTLVVFLFLQSWRATLIPMLAVPVSVIGTFLGLLAFGMSINVLTLFGLVLAIGIVVDDAIVVIENVERIMAAEACRLACGADRDPPGGRRCCHRARVVLGVRARGVHRRGRSCLLQAVRDDDRHRRRAVWARGATQPSASRSCSGFREHIRRASSAGSIAFSRWDHSLCGCRGLRARAPVGILGAFRIFIALAGLLWAKIPRSLHPDGRQGLHGDVDSAA
jgi:hypothetical protein